MKNACDLLRQKLGMGSGRNTVRQSPTSLWKMVQTWREARTVIKTKQKQQQTTNRTMHHKSGSSTFWSSSFQDFGFDRPRATGAELARTETFTHTDTDRNKLWNLQERSCEESKLVNIRRVVWLYQSDVSLWYYRNRGTQN